MIFDRNEQKAVVALLGAGSMGTAIVRRIGAGKKILLGDISEKALERVGEDFRRCAGGVAPSSWAEEVYTQTTQVQVGMIIQTSIVAPQ